MKSLMLFLRYLYADCGEECSASTLFDIKTVEKRIKHEGLSFLTITLPAFAKEFERALELGGVDSTMFTSFSKHRGLPRFLGGFLSQVFDLGTGLLLTEPSINAIRAIRQLTLLHGKMFSICSQEREEMAFAEYVNLDQKVGQYEKLIRNSFTAGLESPRIVVDLQGTHEGDGLVDGYRDASRNASISSFDRISRLLWAETNSNSANTLYRSGIIPQHGPGATADRLMGNHKYDLRLWTDRLEAYFPFGTYAFPNWRSYLERTGLTILDPGSELPSRVISVPKTMKTPRLIAVEPTCMQYVQQGLLRLLSETLQSDKYLWRMMGLNDQTPNQRFAREGSLTGAYATLDLSEASDRVNIWHVERIFQNHDHLLGAIMACRSSKANVPGYGELTLSKFASMGSALCFPVEAMVFLTVVFTAIAKVLNRPLNRNDIKSFSTQVRVFGDDIIVPQRFALAVVETMDHLGFKVNSSKSFWAGRFRESCGKEYYAGFDVSIVKVRQALPSQRQDTQEIISTVSMRNQFFMAGRVKTVEYLDGLIERFIPFPEVSETSPILGKFTWGPIVPEGMNQHTQTPFVKGVVVLPVRRRRQIDGYPALMKYFLTSAARESRNSSHYMDWNQKFLHDAKDNGLPSVDKEHLVYSGRPAALTLKVTRRSPY